MCSKNNYRVVVDGDAADKERLIGSLVSNAANLVTGLHNDNGKVVFYFAFKGDAKLVLKRVFKALTGKQMRGTSFQYMNACATIVKTVS